MCKQLARDAAILLLYLFFVRIHLVFILGIF